MVMKSKVSKLDIFCPGFWSVLFHLRDRLRQLYVQLSGYSFVTRKKSQKEKTPEVLTLELKQTYKLAKFSSQANFNYFKLFSSSSC